MFTEGLDPHSLRWVHEGLAPVMNSPRPINTLSGSIPNGGCGLGIQLPEKFRTGLLSVGASPASCSSPIENDRDMDKSSDAEETIGSSTTITIGNGYRNSVPLYSSDGFSGYTSSKDTTRLQPPQQRNQVCANGYVEDEEEEWSDSDESSGFGRQAGRVFGGHSCDALLRGAVNGTSDKVGMKCRGSYPSHRYFHNVPVIKDEKSTSEKAAVNNPVNYSSESKPFEKEYHFDVPSAPSFNGCDQESSQDDDQILSSRSCGTPFAVGSEGYAVKGASSQANAGKNLLDQQDRDTSLGAEIVQSPGLMPARAPAFHAIGQGPWHSVIAYDACVRLCLYSWARGCNEAPIFLENECELLRNAFGLQHILLQSEEEMLAKRTSGLINDGVSLKPKKIIGKMKVQVRKVRMSVDMPSGCKFLSLKLPMVKLESPQYYASNIQSTLSSGWESLQKVRVLPHLPATKSFSKHSLAYMQASARHIKQVSGLLKTGVTTLRTSTSYEVAQETHSYRLRLKSSTEEDAVRMQPESGGTHIFFPDSLGDGLIVEVYDSKGSSCGQIVAQVASIMEDPSDKLRWWSIYREPEHEVVGRMQLYINYTANQDENNSLKCGPVAETVAHDIVLEVAMKAQRFQRRNLLLYGEWKWLLAEFARYYGVSDAYTRLRYLSYVMDVATPTADCLMLVYDFLLPVILKSHSKNTLSHQENHILGEVVEQIKQILAMVFENYKSLDESSPSGIVEMFMPATGSPAPAPALVPAVKLYNLIHDILSPEAQLKLCSYLQTAAKKRLRRHLAETDEFVAGSNEVVLTVSTAYQKMKELCFNIRNEIHTDIEIHSQHVFPSFVDLPNISASIYNMELCSRLRAFLVAYPPTSPSPPVADLVVAVADFQKDLADCKICPVKGGLDAKELFHLYIILWIQDKRLVLLELCKLEKVKWSGVQTHHFTTPFADDMYDRLIETLNEYKIIICRWPEYTFVLENAIADIEKAIMEALEKQYSDVLSPLKDSMTIKKFGLKYVQKLAKRKSRVPYIVPDEMGILLNTMKRLLDVLRPKIEMQLKSWGSCIPDGGNAGERLNEVTVTLRAKFRNYMQAVVEKLAENTQMQSTTKLKKIIQDLKNVVVESDICKRMQPLEDHLIQTINLLHTVFEVHIFVAVSRGFWDRMGQDVLIFLENRKDIRSWYKASRVIVSVLDDTFASQMQQLLGNALQEKDLEPPRSIMEVRSFLCKDVQIHEDSKFYY